MRQGASNAAGVVLALVLGSTLGSALAAGGGGGGRSGPDASDMHAQPGYLQAALAIKEERWPQAIELLGKHVWRYDRDADGHNWLAYALRKSGKLDEAFKHYKRALIIDPEHRGAHEYIGEAYLMAGQTQMAEQHLKLLAGLCAASCEEYRDLAKAIAQKTASK